MGSQVPTATTIWRGRVQMWEKTTCNRCERAARTLDLRASKQAPHILYIHLLQNIYCQTNFRKAKNISCCFCLAPKQQAGVMEERGAPLRTGRGVYFHNAHFLQILKEHFVWLSSVFPIQALIHPQTDHVKKNPSSLLWNMLSHCELQYTTSNWASAFRLLEAWELLWRGWMDGFIFNLACLTVCSTSLNSMKQQTLSVFDPMSVGEPNF